MQLFSLNCGRYLTGEHTHTYLYGKQGEKMERRAKKVVLEMAQKYKEKAADDFLSVQLVKSLDTVH